jgi:pyruvate dehydrogenase E2 component (dihydrolipoamide acetyltransferase)
MGRIIELTQLSPTMSEGTLVKWIKKVGESVEPGTILAEVETDKAVMEMESFDDGILLALIAKEGERLPIGSPVAVIGDAGEDVAGLIEEAKARIASKTGAAPADQPPVAGAAPSPITPSRPTPSERVQPVSAAPPSSKPAPPVQHAALARGGRILASPLAKKIAAERSIDLALVSGSGPGGRIVKRDILTFTPPPVAAFAVRPDRRVELTGIRRIISQRLFDSKSHIPHYYLNLEFDADPLYELRSQLNRDLAEVNEENPLKISFNDLIVKAVALTLLKHPAVNSSWRGDHILEYGRIDIGIAVAIEGGLITPYVRNADRLGLTELSSSIRELADRAKERRLKPEEYTDGTFTISNLGMFGVTSFSAIINEPEAAILAVGGMEEKAVVKKGAVMPGRTMTVSLSCDHRVIDGAEGGRFLSTFRSLIEHPHTLLVG